MKRYNAILTGGNAVDIGEFQSDNMALAWALQQYGAGVSSVVAADTPYTLTVNKWELDPRWYLVALGIGFLLLAEKKKRKRRRNVR